MTPMEDPTELRGFLARVLDLQAGGRHREAAALCEQRLNGRTPHPAVVLLLANSLIAVGATPRAAYLLDRLPKGMARMPEVLAARGRAALGLGLPGDAAQYLMAAANGMGEDRSLWRDLARAGIEGGSEAVADALGKAASRAPKELVPVIRAAQTSVMIALGRSDAASELLEGELESHPDSVDLRFALGNALKGCGGFDRAQALFRRLAQEAGDDPVLRAEAWAALSSIKRFEDAGDGDLSAMRDALAATEPDSEAAERLGSALAKALDDAGEYGEAFEHAATANAARRARQPAWNEEQERRRLSFARDAFPDRASLGEARPPSGTRPVLVVGMPRSGTSLVEQVISSHPQAAGAGEQLFLTRRFLAQPLNLNALAPRMEPELLRRVSVEYLELLGRLSGGAEVVVDKYPANFFNVGYFLRLFPQGRVVHVRRDPQDTAVSVFMQDFPMGNLYANDLEDIARYMRIHDEMMEHWMSLGDDRILRLAYEDLVSDPGSHVPAFLAHVGLDVHPACLEPHRTDRTVGTLSAWQVRQPMNRSAMGRAENYAEQLGPFRRVLSGEL